MDTYFKFKNGELVVMKMPQRKNPQLAIKVDNTIIHVAAFSNQLAANDFIDFMRNQIEN